MTIVLNGTTGITNDGGYTGDGIIFADTTPANTLVTDTSGNVGIGTSSPSGRLNIAATAATNTTGVNLTGSTTGYHRVLFSNTSGGGQLGVEGSTGGTIATGTTAYATVVGDYANNPLQFATNNTVRATIDSSGNLLVGTTTARGKITSTGSFSDGSTWSSTAAINVNGAFGGAVSFVDGAAGYAVYCADSGNDFYIRGAPNLSSSLTGGVYINDRATSWSSASDERLKTIIEPITDAVNKVCQLRAVIGRYNHEAEEKRHPFLIAQDVQAVLPEAVSVADKQSEEQYLGVSYTDTIPLLVAAIKEQQAIITALTARVTALEGQP